MPGPDPKATAAGLAAALTLFCGNARAGRTPRENAGGHLKTAREYRDIARRLNAVLPAASASEAGTPGTEPALRADLAGRMNESFELMDRLFRLEDGYGAVSPSIQLLSGRDVLRKSLAERQDAFSKALPAYFSVNQRAQGAAYGAVGKPGAGAAAASPVDLESFLRNAEHFSEKFQWFLAEDEAAYKEARARLGRGPAPLFPWAAGATLLAGAGAFAWRLRRRRIPAGAAPAQPAPDEALLAGNYRVERELGRGGMGVVLQALDLTLQRRVAIKRLRGDFAPDPRDAEQFLAEARLVAALQHPNIVKIHTFFKEGNELFLVFELLEGDPLSSRLAGERALPFAVIQAIIRQVGAALDYAHEHKVIHRDLKPANIMLTPAGAAKVMDFGLAHQARGTAANMTRAVAGGTFPYMAPEQELGEVSRQSDIFSLGVCLYEMATGRLPFEGPNFLAQKRERRFKPPSTFMPGLPPSLDAVLARALDPEPKSRFRSAAEFAAALEAR